MPRDGRRGVGDCLVKLHPCGPGGGRRGAIHHCGGDGMDGHGAGIYQGGAQTNVTLLMALCREILHRFSTLHSKKRLLRYHDPLAEGDDVGVLCIPANLQADVVWTAHQLAAHRGVDGTMDKLMLSCHFPSMRKITRGCTSGCLTCQQKGDCKTDQRHTYATILKGYPFQNYVSILWDYYPRQKMETTTY